jgi:pimeloyl-ACP methyl ester carboxylesterase
MPRARANGIELEYEVIGARNARPLVLIMGLGAQMVLWDDEFCAALAARGHRVVRFDNRDVGLSSKIDGWRTLDVVAAMAGWAMGRPVAAPYTLSDMAADTVDLLDKLGFSAAHLVGASLGGMIAQTLAIEHPRRVLSLTSIMSTTGNPRLPRARPEAAAALLEPPPRDREGAMARAVKVFRTIGSPAFPLDEARVRERAGRSFDRCSHPAGVARQMLAVLASGSRVEGLRRVTVPTLVIHGSDDPLIPVAAGVETARLVPGAELLLIEGMGHDLPRAVWPRVIDGISALTTRAAPRARATSAHRRGAS